MRRDPVPVEFIGIARTADRSETAAWERAREILEVTRERAGDFLGRRDTSQAEGSRRLRQFAAAGEVHDKRLWTALSEAAGAAGNSTALVGSYEQVAESLLDYVAVGATTLLIRGYDPLLDAAAPRHGPGRTRRPACPKGRRSRSRPRHDDGRRTVCRAPRASGPSRPSPIRRSSPRWPRGGSSPRSGRYRHEVPATYMDERLVPAVFGHHASNYLLNRAIISDIIAK
jgi:hypothetical protein